MPSRTEDIKGGTVLPRFIGKTSKYLFEND